MKNKTTALGLAGAVTITCALAVGTTAPANAQTANTSVSTTVTPVAESTVAFSARAVLGTSFTSPTVVSGTATPGARVILGSTPGDLEREVTADPSGDWQAEIPGLGIGGIVTVHAVEVIDGEATGRTADAEVDYGAAVGITSPTNGSTHAGGRLTFRGTGEPGALVYLFREGSPFIISPGRVDSNGQWALGSGSIPGTDATYRVEQRGNGQNVTTATVRLNPDATGTAPLAVTTAASGSTVIAPSGRVTIRGTGSPGATVTITDDGGTELGSTPVSTVGTWGIIAPLRPGTQTLDITYAVPGQPVQHLEHVLSLWSRDALRVTSPVADTVVTSASGNVEFTGTAVAGSSVRILAGNGRVIATGKASADGSWRVSGDTGHRTLTAFVENTAAGQTKLTDEVRFSVERTARPFVIATPSSGSTVRSSDGVVTLTGTGAPGARVQLTAGNGRVILNTPVLEDGSWSARGVFALGTSNPTVTYTPAGGTPQTSPYRLTVATQAVPLVISSPTSGSTVRTADGTVVITGSGTSGARVQIAAGNGRVILATTVRQDGSWSATGVFALGTSNPTVTYTPAGGSAQTSAYRLTTTR